MASRKIRKTRKVKDCAETPRTEGPVYVRFLLSRLRDLYIENVLLKMMLDTLQTPLPEDFVRHWRTSFQAQLCDPVCRERIGNSFVQCYSALTLGLSSVEDFEDLVDCAISNPPL